MREILFRGKRLDNGLWIEGCLRQYPNGRAGICCNILLHTLLVDPETVGQYTGLKDNEGRKIFEGDIVKDFHRIGVVEYGAFNCSCCDGVYGWEFRNADIRSADCCTVIGNIHDNPELLMEEENND